VQYKALPLIFTTTEYIVFLMKSIERKVGALCLYLLAIENAVSIRQGGGRLVKALFTAVFDQSRVDIGEHFATACASCTKGLLVVMVSKYSGLMLILLLIKAISCYVSYIKGRVYHPSKRSIPYNLQGVCSMSKIILLTSGTVQMEAELNESKTAALLFDKMPISGIVNTWGDEIYFPIPVEAEAENATALVEEGDLAYWPDGKCFCIFFGPTPASTGSEIRPASPVNLLGRLKGDPKLWKKVEPGSTIKLEKA
jgi:uncharacterized protein